MWNLIVFICNSHMPHGAEHLFICLFAICVSSLVSSPDLLLIFNLSFLLSCWILRVLCIFWIHDLYQKCILQTFFSIYVLSFHPLYDHCFLLGNSTLENYCPDIHEDTQDIVQRNMPHHCGSKMKRTKARCRWLWYTQQ